MASDSDGGGGGGGFGLGVFLGGLVGVVLGAYLASGPARGQVKQLGTRTIELTGSARRAAQDPESPVRRAIQEGVSAARRRRRELEEQAQPIVPGPPGVAGREGPGGSEPGA